MFDRQLRFWLGPGPLCHTCSLLAICGAAELDDACRPDWGDPEHGGVNALHPKDPDTWAHLEEVGGAGFDDIVAQPQAAIELPPFGHRIRPRSVLRGQLSDPVYYAGPEVVRKSAVTSCHELRQLVGLSDAQQVGLVLFGGDKRLEMLWAWRLVHVPRIAAAGYAPCVPPSYSNYLDRPRTEFLVNAKRSLAYFALLQTHGVPTMPRVAWIIEHDARRFATWVNANPAVEWVALDVACTSVPGWRREMRLLALFDRLTNRRLRYLIHGPAVRRRCVDLYRLIGPDRVHLTNTRAASMKPTVDGASFGDRFASEREVIESARLQAFPRERMAAEAA
jgi:hypothetical protein